MNIGNGRLQFNTIFKILCWPADYRQKEVYMSNYKYYQPNKKDLKDNHGDCVIRALTKVTEKSWLEVFDGLVPIVRKEQNDLL